MVIASITLAMIMIEIFILHLTLRRVAFELVLELEYSTQRTCCKVQYARQNVEAWYSCNLGRNIMFNKSVQVLLFSWPYGIATLSTKLLRATSCVFKPSFVLTENRVFERLLSILVVVFNVANHQYRNVCDIVISTTIQSANHWLLTIQPIWDDDEHALGWCTSMHLDSI